MAEQSYLANRTIQQGAQSRGLGSSGIKDLSVLQSQLAQGRATSDLEKENTNVQRAAIDAKLGLDESLRTSLTGAELQSQEANMNADRYAMDLQQKDRDLMLQLMDMAGAGATPDTIKAYADILGLNMETAIGGDGKTLQEQLEGIAPGVDTISDDKYATITANTKVDKIADLLRWLDPSKYGKWALQNLFTEKGDSLKDTEGLAELNWRNSGNGTFNYKIGSENFSGTPEEAKQKIDKLYQGKQYFGKEITTKVQQNGAIRFVFDGREFSTYASALTAVQSKINQE